MSLFQILYNPCDSSLVKVLMSAVKVVFTLIQWGIPLVLIVMCTIDLFKAVSSGDEKKTKEVQKVCIRRLIYAVVAFLVPSIIGLVFGFVGDILNVEDKDDASNTFESFLACWDNTEGGDTKEYKCYVNGHELDVSSKSECEQSSGSWEEVTE